MYNQNDNVHFKTQLFDYVLQLYFDRKFNVTNQFFTGSYVYFTDFFDRYFLPSNQYPRVNDNRD